MLVVSRRSYAQEKERLSLEIAPVLLATSCVPSLYTRTPGADKRFSKRNDTARQKFAGGNERACLAQYFTIAGQF